MSSSSALIDQFEAALESARESAKLAAEASARGAFAIASAQRSFKRYVALLSGEEVPSVDPAAPIDATPRSLSSSGGPNAATSDATISLQSKKYTWRQEEITALNAIIGKLGESKASRSSVVYAGLRMYCESQGWQVDFSHSDVIDQMTLLKQRKRKRKSRLTG